MKENKMKFLFVLLFSLNVWAGNEKGNGGNVLACFWAGTMRYTLVDFFENPDVNQWQDIISWELTVQAKINEIKQWSPQRGALLYDRLDTFVRYVQFKNGGQFSSSGDIGPVVIPDGCNVVQAATQFFNKKTQRYEFFLNTDVWVELSEFQKAGLVLHEILLTEAVESGHETSKRTRELNAKLWANDFANKGADYFQDYLEHVMNYRYADRTTYWMEMFDDNGKPRHNEFWPNGQPFRIYSRKGSTVCVLKNCWTTTGEVDSQPDLYFDSQGHVTSGSAADGTFYWNGQTIKVAGQIGFFPNGNLFKINLAENLVWHRGTNPIEMGQTVIFYDTGDIELFTLSHAMPISILPDGPTCPLGNDRTSDSISFHPNGVVKEAYINGSCKLQKVNGSTATYSDMRVNLDNQGRSIY